MAYEFGRWILQETKTTRVILITQKATAEYFGWDTAFPEWTPRTRVDHHGQRVVAYTDAMKPAATWFGGKRLTISRHPSTSGNPAGKTHCFRMKGPFSNRHLRQMAEVAGDRFEWMETKWQERRRRSVWLNEEA